MAIFKGKHFFWSLFLIKLQPWRNKLQYRYLPKNIVSFLRTAFFKEHVMENQVSDFSYVPELHFWNIIFCSSTLLAAKVRCSLPQWSYGKNILRNMKQSQMILCLILFQAFHWRNLKEQIAERRNFPEISIYQANLYKQ